MKVLLVDNVNKIAEDILKNADIETIVAKSQTSEELSKIIEDYDGIILRNRTHIDKEVLAHAKKLKIIARAGVGVDNIDVEAATARGIWVVNSPDGNTEATAEHTVAMILALSRNIPQSFEHLKNGVFERTKFIGNELLGKTIGIVGFGKIGSRVAEILKVFGMQIFIYDPFANKEKVEKFGYRIFENLDDMLPLIDYLTVHVPKNKDTLNMIDEKNIYKLKKGAKIINCARGGIINEYALKKAIEEKYIFGAALDVFVDEPEIDKCPLYNFSDKVIIVPHLGASTIEAQTKVAKDVAEQVADVFKGVLPKTPVNQII